MSNNTQWGGQWTGQQNTVGKKESGVNGHQNNWSGQSPVGGQHNGQHARNSYNGQTATSYNGHIAPRSYSYTGHSSSATYCHHGQVFSGQSANVQGWASTNIMTGQSTGYSGNGQLATPGYMNRPPPYGKHKKVEIVMITCFLCVYYVIQNVDWDKQVDQVFMEELDKMFKG